MTYAIRQRRAAINTEYVLLMICAALAVTLGVSVLSNAMMFKHIQVAEALSDKPLIPTSQVAGELVASAPADNGDGTYTISWEGGTSPYTVSSGGSTIGVTNDTSFVVTPVGGTNNWVVIDDNGVESLPIVLECPVRQLVIRVSGMPNEDYPTLVSVYRKSDNFPLTEFEPATYEDGIAVLRLSDVPEGVYFATAGLDRSAIGITFVEDVS